MPMFNGRPVTPGQLVALTEMTRDLNEKTKKTKDMTYDDLIEVLAELLHRQYMTYASGIHDKTPWKDLDRENKEFGRKFAKGVYEELSKLGTWTI